jgi:uncharacterized membrane protein
MGVIQIEPIGVEHFPASVAEFCLAIRCVLIAVYGLHQLGFMHTVIRWSNIVDGLGGEWYLIDCYYVCKTSDKQMCVTFSSNSDRELA